ncbi:hypothetical protein [Bradyrhizobium elkanii]|uniref:hypothetical protein n=1 Tax=Bradyrhizobium elkanii TaxID=29448 RepID=UPI003513D5D9
MYKNVMVASSKRQATAMIAWMKLDADVWEPLAYGDPVTKLYAHAKLVRPSEGVDQAHSDWVFEKLVPNLCLTATTVPRTGRSRRSTSNTGQQQEQQAWR